MLPDFKFDMNLSNENRLLLYCAQTRIPEGVVLKVRKILGSSLNWEEVLKPAFWHGIAPLLYDNLKNMQKSHGVPENVMNKLKMAYYRTVAKNLCMYAELRPILESLREKDLEVVILRGAALAETVYDDMGLRPMGDIDLLVKKEDLPHAEETIIALGYHFHGDMSPVRPPAPNVIHDPLCLLFCPFACIHP